jgi:hypothetical protein
MATPWPDKPCLHCRRTITDLLSEMVLDADQTTPDYQTVLDRKPGGAITCPYCQEAVEYDANGEDLVASRRTPLRYSRAKTEDLAQKYGQVFLGGEVPGTDPSDRFQAPPTHTAWQLRRAIGSFWGSVSAHGQSRGSLPSGWTLPFRGGWLAKSVTAINRFAAVACAEPGPSLPTLPGLTGACTVGSSELTTSAGDRRRSANLPIWHTPWEHGCQLPD